MQSKLYNKNRFSQYLSIDVGRNTYNIELIYIYDESGIITYLGYFEDGRKLPFNGEVRLRRKRSFERKENFIIKYKYIGVTPNPYEIYIYKDNIDFEYLGREVRNQCRYNSEDVFYSIKYKKYRIGSYVHYDPVKTLSNKKWRWENKATYIINHELLDINDFHFKSEEGLERTFRKIRKLNKRIKKENDKLRVREKLNI